MFVTLLSALAIGLVLALAALVVFLPKKVEYIESITALAPVDRVYDAIRFQARLMAWSAWPQETKSKCAVQNEDGQLGAQTVFLDLKGKKIGYQEVTELEENKKVGFCLKSFVAPFEEEVRLAFMIREVSPGQTEVLLWFDETLKKPLFLIAYFGGIPRWVRGMHRKDLANLKHYVENA